MKLFIAILAWGLFCYFGVAFYYMSGNPIKWGHDGRFVFLAVFIGWAAYMGIVYTREDDTPTQPPSSPIQ